MIATVRIAPVEQWCDLQKNFASLRPTRMKWEGVTIEIIPASMIVKAHQHSEPCRKWKMSEATKQMLEEIAGYDISLGSGREPYICEHMLEMD